MNMSNRSFFERERDRERDREGGREEGFGEAQVGFEFAKGSVVLFPRANPINQSEEKANGKR